MAFDFPIAVLEERMRHAQALASDAVARGDAPFAALLVDEQGAVVIEAANTSRSTRNIVAHAEMNLLIAAARALGTRTFPGYAIVVNAAPCSMCMSALVKAKLGALFYGAPMEPHTDPHITPEQVAAQVVWDIKVRGGVLADACAAQIAAARATSPRGA